MANTCTESTAKAHICPGLTVFFKLVTLDTPNSVILQSESCLLSISHVYGQLQAKFTKSLASQHVCLVRLEQRISTQQFNHNKVRALGILELT